MLTVTAAAVEPVTLAQAKAHLNVLHTDSDVHIGALVSAARAHVEMTTGRALAAAQYMWPAGPSWQQLPLAPIAAVAAATYIDSSGARVALPAYTVDLERGALALGSGSLLGSKVNITFTTAAPAVVPEPLQQAILLQVQQLWDGEDEKRRDTIAALVAPYRLNLGV
ncbi:hypothetical protein ACFFGH_06615 [Lysobacter korlensis]|uniref:PhiE125 gp8 family phage protein n=1 Tax=Lysobacter korlensis TaxID=553636 RepID=A0ABV6RKL0_9GAMM